MKKLTAEHVRILSLIAVNTARSDNGEELAVVSCIEADSVAYVHLVGKSKCEAEACDSTTTVQAFVHIPSNVVSHFVCSSLKLSDAGDSIYKTEILA